MRSKKSFLNRILRTSALLLLLAPFFAGVAAHAQTGSSAIAQGFSADSSKGDIVAGALVSFTTGDAKQVELATSESASLLAGVVDSDPFVAISGSGQEVQVVLNGTTNVLVSDINGDIHAGDKITISPIAGTGMLATADSQVVGTAESDFDAAAAQTRTVTDSHGKEHTVHIGSIPLQVGVSYYQAPGSNFLPPFVQNLANSLAGRPVSFIRVLLCGALLLIGFVSIGILVYASVRSAMTSIGRNPLAAGAIKKGMYQMIAIAAGLLGGTLLASYLLLAL
ncbi:MAG TPA: hypothetical protein VLH86_05600 [Patescibacteria group bacterium]|nr:hypothetical protein [Patescibacteria group bacterium]